MMALSTGRTVFVLVLLPVILIAQAQHDTVPLKHWSAPLFWQPSQAETVNAIVGDATTPANALVFVGMTPCRVVDTRNNSGFTGAFGPPILVAGGTRTFPIRSSATCSIPSIAQAYSFNITIVPPGFVNYITLWPTGQPRPNASTLNGYVNTVIANAAIVPAGANGSVDVFASDNTDLIIDINGYYAPQTGMTLAQGNAAAPSLSFAGDAGTGIFSSAPGVVNIATGGTSRVQVSNDRVDIATTNALSPSLRISTPGEGIRLQGQSTGNPNAAWLSFYDAAGTPIGYVGDGASGDSSTYLASYTQNVYLYTAVGAALTAAANGRVGIGTTAPQSKLEVLGEPAGSGIAQTAIRGASPDGYGVIGSGGTGTGVFGTGHVAIWGQANQGAGNWAGFFNGDVFVSGAFVNSSDERLKEGVVDAGYGLSELLQLRPVTWNWKDRADDGRQLGFIAQEVETVLPELVKTDKDSDLKALNYIGLTPVVIKAIQELHQQNAELAARVKQLELMQTKDN